MWVSGFFIAVGRSQIIFYKFFFFLNFFGKKCLGRIILRKKNFGSFLEKNANFLEYFLFCDFGEKKKFFLSRIFGEKIGGSVGKPETHHFFKRQVIFGGGSLLQSSIVRTLASILLLISYWEQKSRDQQRSSLKMADYG